MADATSGRHDFPFPFTPYPVQQQLMEAVYDTLDTGGCGVFESPTGTGKSLSLICSSLHWLLHGGGERALRQHVTSTVASASSKTLAPSAEPVIDSTEPSWVMDFEKDSEQRKIDDALAVVQEGRTKLVTRLEKVKRQGSLAVELAKRAAKQASSSHVSKRARPAIAKVKKDTVDDDDLLLTWSDDPLDKYACSSSDSDVEEHDDEYEEAPQIIFCSRTHSQLSQFVNEIKRTAFADELRCVSLGARKNLCVHPEISQLKSASQMNDRCLEMQKSAGKKKTAEEIAAEAFAAATAPGLKTKISKVKSSCPYLSEDSQRLFRDHVLTKVQDLEELHELGANNGICSYFGTRRAVSEAHIITMPYPALLHRGTRESLGVRLAGNIIIIDEAHNLIESINDVHGAQVNLRDLRKAHSQLSQYLEKYQTRLKRCNLVNIRQILDMLQSCMQYLGGWKKPGASPAGIVPTSQNENPNTGSATASRSLNFGLPPLPESESASQNHLISAPQHDGFVSSAAVSDHFIAPVKNFKVGAPTPDSKATVPASPFVNNSSSQTSVFRSNELTFSLKMDNINLLQIVRYMDDSEIVKKVNGFIEKYQSNEVQANVEQPAQQTLTQTSLGKFKDFLIALSNGADRDGRVVVTTAADPSEACFRYLMLNPLVHFQEIVDQARSVVLCGGTMQPFEHFVTQLFSKISPDRLKLFSCGHVVPPENIQGFVLCKGPTDVEFEFTATRRTEHSMIDELGRCVANVCSVAPGGVIAFFPSYAYEQAVCLHWQNSGVLARIGNHKQIFREPRNGADSDALLTAYADCIQVRKQGAFLTSVVGGKMSEGINFSDDLARCVIMVGLPYANPKDPELKERMAYYDQCKPQTDPSSTSAGQAYYTNLCMRAVNQSVGRAIRHRNDYATILFADMRYARENIRKQLPSWLQPRLSVANSFGEAQRALCTFFNNRKK